MVAETRFRKLRACEFLQDVYEGQKYKDGKPLESETPMKEAA